MVEEDVDTTMKRLSGSGFVKSLTYKFIKRNNKTVYCTEVDYYAKDHPCDNCGTDAYRLLKAERTGVMITCAYCKRTTGPMSKEAGVIRNSYEIPVDDAIAILKSRNAHKRTITDIMKAKIPQKRLAESRERPDTVS